MVMGKNSNLASTSVCLALTCCLLSLCGVRGGMVAGQQGVTGRQWVTAAPLSHTSPTPSHQLLHWEGQTASGETRGRSSNSSNSSSSSNGTQGSLIALDNNNSNNGNTNNSNESQGIRDINNRGGSNSERSSYVQVSYPNRSESQGLLQAINNSSANSNSSSCGLRVINTGNNNCTNTSDIQGLLQSINDSSANSKISSHGLRVIHTSHNNFTNKRSNHGILKAINNSNRSNSDSNTSRSDSRGLHGNINSSNSYNRSSTNVSRHDTIKEQSLSLSGSSMGPSSSSQHSNSSSDQSTVSTYHYGKSSDQHSLSNDRSFHYEHRGQHSTTTTRGPHILTPTTTTTTRGPHILTPSFTQLSTRSGQTTVFTCVVTHLGNRQVSWIRERDLLVLGSGQVTFSSDSRVEVSRVGDSWRLTLRYTQTRDAGGYGCQVNTQPPLAVWFSLTVLEAHARIVGEEQVYVQAGSTLSLLCIVREQLAIPGLVLWYHNNLLVNRESGRVRVETTLRNTTTTRIVTLKPATATDSGNYTCWPSAGRPHTVLVPVIRGDLPAAMYHGSSAPLDCCALLLMVPTAAAAALSWFLLHLTTTTTT